VNPCRGSGRCGGGCGCGGGSVSAFSTRVSSGTHGVVGSIYRIFAGRRSNSLCIAEEEREEDGQEGQRMPVCVCVGAHNRVRVRASV